MMKRTIYAILTATLLVGAAAGLSGCYATSASVGVGVESAPPEPVGVYYDSRPGYTYIEGRWVWTAYGWQWYPGYWAAERPGYVYIAGYWDYYGGRYSYRPGTWARHRNGYVYVGGGWTRYSANSHYDYRNRRWVPRSGYGGHYSGGYSRGGYSGGRSSGGSYSPGVRDHRGGGGGGYQRSRSAPSYSPGVRDHRRRH